MNKTVKILLGIIIIVVLALATHFIVYNLTVNMLNEQEQGQSDLPEYTVGDQKIHTIICEINNDFELEIPETFTKMDEETLKVKYPLESRPGLV